MDSVDVIVAGAGVVGLAVARAFAMQGREVIVLESENAIGTGTSSRNSEVIHAGIYYPQDSLKAKFCVRGRELLYAFCEETGVPFKRCGKYIVATDPAQAEQLESIRDHALGNGVSDIRWLSAEEAIQTEPALSCAAALHSPSTGIIDSHGFMLALQGQAEHHGAMVALMSKVERVSHSGDHVHIRVADLSDPDHHQYEVSAKLLVNATGHSAVPVANAVQHSPLGNYERVFTKGNYFRLQGAAPFSRLIYPVPEPGGLGVHLTLDLGGQARFGPDVEPIDRFEYEVQPARAERFYDAIRRYWPALADDSLLPDYSGFRPKLIRDGQPFNDFSVEVVGADNAAQIVHLLGIESPGLTSAMAIAEHVVSLGNQ